MGQLWNARNKIWSVLETKSDQLTDLSSCKCYVPGLGLKPSSWSCDLFILQFFCKLLGLVLIFERLSYEAMGLSSEFCQMQVSCAGGSLEDKRNATVIAFNLVETNVQTSSVISLTGDFLWPHDATRCSWSMASQAVENVPFFSFLIYISVFMLQTWFGASDCYQHVEESGFGAEKLQNRWVLTGSWVFALEQLVVT